MTRIDPIRLARIFGTLSSKDKPAASKTHTSDKTVDKEQLSSARDEAVLKLRLRQQLQTLKQKSANFSEEAPYVAIQEIMGWEFGDQFYSHPEFKLIVNSIVDSIKSSPELRTHMNAMITELVDD
jgi:hypothetical protein